MPKEIEEMTKQFDFHATMEKKNDEKQVVKGFASLNNSDRSKDFVSPESFDLKRFMNNPQLLHNHKLWRDSNGNGTNIGKIQKAIVATVREHESDEKQWSVINDSNEVVGELTKSSNPDLKIGSRGLYVEAKVTKDKIWEKVLDGDLNAFSWRGQAAFAKSIINGVEKIFTKFIDIFEVSLVTVPDNFASTFEVAKSLWGTDLQMIGKDAREDLQTFPIHKVKFSTELFNKAQIMIFLKDKGMEDTEIVEQDGEFISVQKDAKEFHGDHFFTFELMTGVQIVAGESIIDTFNFEEDLTNNLTKDVDNLKIDKTDETKRSESMAKESGNKKAAADTENKAVDTEDIEKGTESTVDSEQETAKEATDDSAKETEDTTESEDTSKAVHDDEEEEKKKSVKKKVSKTAKKSKTEDTAKAEESSDDTAEEASATEANAEAEETEDVEKGAVQDSLDQIMGSKMVKLRPVFDKIRAFDEAIWHVSSDSEELKDIVKELAALLSDDADLMKALIKVEELKKSDIESRLEKIEKALEESNKDDSTEEQSKDEGETEETEKSNSDETSADTDKETDTEDEGSSTEKEPTTEEIQKALDELDPIDHAQVKNMMTNSALAGMGARLSEMESKTKKTERELANMKKSAVSTTERSEHLQKSNTEEEDPNDVFGGSSWPFQ